MSKYIDAEKLIMEIKFAKSVYDNPKRVVHGVADAYRQDGRVAMCEDILKKIDSLQQEQPEKTLTFGGFVDKVGTWFAHLRLDKFRKTFNGDIFPATQLVQEYDLFVRELSKTYSDKQEQPEQGQSKEGIVCDNNEFIKFPDGSYIDLRPDLNKMAFDVKDGDEVIVNISRKSNGKDTTTCGRGTRGYSQKERRDYFYCCFCRWLRGWVQGSRERHD